MRPAGFEIQANPHNRILQVKAILHLLFSFRGRISRKQWWFGLVVLGILSVPGSLILSLMLAPIQTSDVIKDVIGVVGIPMLWILFALNTKRLHDRNRPGWWILIALIPVVGAIYCIWQIAFMSGNKGQNRYGPPPQPLFSSEKESDPPV